MLQRKNKAIHILLFLFICVFIFESCIESKKRDFFIQMKEEYPHLRIDSLSFFIKGFGINSNSKKVKNNFYWKMSCEKGSYFYLTGYLRLLNDSIILMPIDYEDSETFKEFKLFDFSASLNSTWSLVYETKGNMIYGDSVTYLGCAKSQNDSIYFFGLHPFYYYKHSNSRTYLDHWFKVDISKDIGILNIAAMGAGIQDTIFNCSFLPKIELLDKRNGNLRL